MIGIPVMPQDVPNPKATLPYAVRAVIANSTKPIFFSTDNCKVNRACIDLLRAAFAGRFPAAGLRHQPAFLDQPALLGARRAGGDHGHGAHRRAAGHSARADRRLHRPVHAGRAGDDEQRRMSFRAGDDPASAARGQVPLRQLVDHLRHADGGGAGRLDRDHDLPHRRGPVGPFLQAALPHHGPQLRQPRPRRAERLGKDLQPVLRRGGGQRPDRQLRHVRHRHDVQPRAAADGRGDLGHVAADRRRHVGQSGNHRRRLDQADRPARRGLSHGRAHAPLAAIGGIPPAAAVGPRESRGLGGPRRERTRTNSPAKRSASWPGCSPSRCRPQTQARLDEIIASF